MPAEDREVSAVSGTSSGGFGLNGIIDALKDHDDLKDKNLLPADRA